MPVRNQVAVLLFALSSLGCAAPPRVAPPGQVAHTVLFWLRGDAPPGTAAALVGFYRERVPAARGVVAVLAGPPLPSEREVVDDSFAVAATTVFASAADEAAWQTDPIHDELRQRFLGFVERVAVFDTLSADG